MNNHRLKTGPVAFVWEDFGPIHADRCNAVARSLGKDEKVFGIEIFGKSAVYEWDGAGEGIGADGFAKVTLFPDTTREGIAGHRKLYRLLRACIVSHAKSVFLCHYQHPSIFLTAIALRFLGRRVFVMGDSKFDDRPRGIWLELIKTILYLPYNGGIAASARSRDYMRFLGLSQSRIVEGYNTMSLERIRKQAGVERAPAGTEFAERNFSVIARLVAKKNVAAAIDAYSIYLRTAKSPRKLYLYGSGELEAELRAQVDRLSLGDQIFFIGFLQAPEIAKALGSTLALILPSTEEQFGNVATEAQAMGVPVILSSNCGACDPLMRTGVNGFVVEPMNVEGIAYFMTELSDNESLWRRMSAAADGHVMRLNACHFAEGVQSLLAMPR